MKNHLIQSMLRLTTIGVICAAVAVQTMADDEKPSSDDKKTDTAAEKVEKYVPKTKAELRKTLSALQYKVTQNEATEPAFRNLYWNNKKDGIYRCIVCDLPLFSSETKYKSGTGWPSFFAPINKKHLGSRKDWKLIYTRIEVHCGRCGAHLGHVFDDGPRPTGKRFCMNSASLKFVEKKDKDSKDGEAESNPSDSAKREN